MRKLIFASLIFIIISVMPLTAHADGSSAIVTFSESTQQRQSKTITINNLAAVSSATVNTGTVSYSKNGNNITISVSGGSPSRTNAPAVIATSSKTSSTNSFSTTMSYSSGGYSGTLSKDGASYVISGSYTPADTKSVSGYVDKSANSFSATAGYNSGGYSGTLFKSGSSYVVSGSCTSSSTITASSRWSNSTNYFYSSVSYNSNGYSGTLYKNGAAYKSGSKWYQNYSGTATKPGSDTRVWRQQYSGTATKSESDTRVWQQNYRGTVYGVPTNYYSYTVTVNYSLAMMPVITLNSPANGGVYNVGDTVVVSATGTNCDHICAYVGSNYLDAQNGNNFSATYVFTAAGTYTIYARGRNTLNATDPNSMAANSNSITVTVTDVRATLNLHVKTYSASGALLNTYTDSAIIYRTNLADSPVSFNVEASISPSNVNDSITNISVLWNKNGKYQPIPKDISSSDSQGLYTLTATSQKGMTKSFTVNISYANYAPEATIKYTQTGIHIQTIDGRGVSFNVENTTGGGDITEASKATLAKNIVDYGNLNLASHTVTGSAIIKAYTANGSKAEAYYDLTGYTTTQTTGINSYAGWVDATKSAFASLAFISFTYDGLVNGKVNIYTLDNAKYASTGSALSSGIPGYDNPHVDDVPFDRSILQPHSVVAPTVAGYTFLYSVVTDAAGTSVQNTNSSRTLTLSAGTPDTYVRFMYAPILGAITVTVKDSNTGLALPNSTVTCNGKTFTTDQIGQATYTLLPLGSYTVQASKSGYSSGSVSATLTATTLAQSITIYLTPVTGSITVTVKDSATSQIIQGAIVTCNGQNLTTNSSGQAIFNALPLATYAIQASKTDYGSSSASSTLTVGSPNQNVIISLSPVTGSITVMMMEYGTTTKLSGATVTCGSSKLTTDSSGQAKFNTLALGNYSLQASLANYCSNTGNATLTATSPNQNVTIYLTPITGSIAVTVMEEGTTTELTGATVTCNDGSQFTGLRLGDYTIQASLTGYNANYDILKLTPDRPNQSTTIYLKPVTGPITVIVKDKETGNKLSGATVTCNGSIQTTDSSGQVTFNGLRIKEEGYGIYASLPGYKSGSVWSKIDNTITIDLEPIKGSITVTVRDGLDFYLLDNVKIICERTPTDKTTVECNGGTQFTNLHLGQYTITASLTGYDDGSKSVTLTAAVPDQVVEIDLSPITGDITVKVVKQGLETPLPGAEVTSSRAIQYTDTEGNTTFKLLRKGPHTFTASLEGYYDKSDSCDINKTLKIPLAPKEGKILVTVKDNDTRKIIQGATVSCGGSTQTTDIYGQALFTNLTPATYTVEASKTGYISSSDSAIVSPNATTNANIFLNPDVKISDFTITFISDLNWREYYFDTTKGSDTNGDGELEYPRNTNTDIKTTQMPINDAKLLVKGAAYVKAGVAVRGYARINKTPDVLRFTATYTNDQDEVKTSMVNLVHDTGDKYTFQWIVPMDTKYLTYVTFDAEATVNGVKYGNEKWADTWPSGNTDRKVFFVNKSVKDTLQVNQAY